MKFFIIMFSMLFLFLLGCEDESSTGPDTDAAKASVDSANAALEDVLDALMNSEVNQPSDINFEEPYNLFNQAYKQDPNNPDANLGLALTNLLMITQSPEMSSVFNEWQALFGGSGSFSKVSGNNSFFPSSANAFKFPVNRLVKGMMNLPKNAVNDLPQINTIQEMIETVILPRLDFAAEALDVVDDHPDFVFMVSPRMQGDADADSLEIDLTEIYVLELMINMLRAQANLTVAYSVDVWGFDSLEAITAFSKGGSFLKLRHGPSPMQDAKSAFLTALNKLESGLVFLMSETDPQDDDLIKLDPGTQVDMSEVSNRLVTIRNLFNQPGQYTDDWDDDPSTPDETITIDFSEIFDNPANDLKALLPDYSIMVQGLMLQNGPDVITIYLPMLIWNANSFNEWIFPDPTFSGFLPGMTDSEFKRIFGISSDDWQKIPE